MASLDRVADVASITTKEELANDDEFRQELDRRKDDYAYWEQQVDAALYLLSRKGLMNVHMLRKGVESIDKGNYQKLSYYERWAISMAKHCLESGVLTQEDFNRRYGAPLQSTDEQLFHPGDQVRVHHENYATRWIKPHLRTPGYLYGKVGTIERCCGSFPNPEHFAYDLKDTKDHRQPLYRVRFHQHDIWDEYDGGADDTIDVEIYQHWLTPASATDPLVEEKSHVHHDHDHEHDHDHDHDHVHEARAQVEQTAVDREGTARPAQHLAESLISALLDKNVFTSDELRKQIETNQMAGTEQRGAQVVVEAWLNPDFRARLLQDGKNTIAQFLNMEMSANIVAVENTEHVHNLVVCTLCSCYPRQLLGLPPGWYKSRSYRARAPRSPRAVLKEFGTTIPEHVQIRVHDSTADLRYLVIPRRPASTENWTREQLLPIVTRDSMVGVCEVTV